jgi:hypothetical protein
MLLWKYNQVFSDHGIQVFWQDTSNIAYIKHTSNKCVYAVEQSVRTYV